MFFVHNFEVNGIPICISNDSINDKYFMFKVGSRVFKFNFNPTEQSGESSHYAGINNSGFRLVTGRDLQGANGFSIYESDKMIIRISDFNLINDNIRHIIYELKVKIVAGIKRICELKSVLSNLNDKKRLIDADKTTLKQKIEEESIKKDKIDDIYIRINIQLEEISKLGNNLNGYSMDLFSLIKETHTEQIKKLNETCINKIQNLKNELVSLEKQDLQINDEIKDKMKELNKFNKNL